jgi:hypothetical protein
MPKRLLQAATITLLLNVLAALSIPTGIQTSERSLSTAKFNTPSELAGSASAQMRPH